MKFASYVRYIGTFLKQKKVSASRLRSFLWHLPFEYGQSTVAVLEKAETLHSIFIELEKHFSFWDYEVFECIIEEYDLDRSNEKLRYTEHFESYLNKHIVSGLDQINPLLSEPGVTNLVLDFDIINCSLSKMSAFKEVVATSLNVQPVALRLLNSSEAGQAPKADNVFSSEEKSSASVMSNNITKKENLAASGKLTNAMKLSKQSPLNITQQTTHLLVAAQRSSYHN